MCHTFGEDVHPAVGVASVAGRCKIVAHVVGFGGVARDGLDVREGVDAVDWPRGWVWTGVESGIVVWT